MGLERAKCSLERKLCNLFPTEKLSKLQDKPWNTKILSIFRRVKHTSAMKFLFFFWWQLQVSNLIRSISKYYSFIDSFIDSISKTLQMTIFKVKVRSRANAQNLSFVFSYLFVCFSRWFIWCPFQCDQSPPLLVQIEVRIYMSQTFQECQKKNCSFYF